MAIMLSFFSHGCVEQGQTENVKAGVSTVVVDNVVEGLSLDTLDGGTLSESDLKGKVLLVVNVASQCGYTRQYEGLQTLHEKYAGRGLVVIGVPCNQFGNQEPGSADEIMSFTKSRYGVDFPLLAKQDVNGQNRSEFLKRLMGQASDQSNVGWNFEKFLVGRGGRVLERFSSGVSPESRTLVSAIESALSTPTP